MKELERLVDTSQGLQRELLCEAAREVAPEHARARVLETLGIASSIASGVAAGIASSIAAGGSAAGPSGAAAPGSGMLQPPVMQAPSTALGVGAKLGALLNGALSNASVLVPIGAAAIGGAGLIGVIQLRSAAEGEPAPAPREHQAPSSVASERALLPELGSASAVPAVPARSTATKPTPILTQKKLPAAPLDQIDRTPLDQTRLDQTPLNQTRNDDSLGEQLAVLEGARQSLAALEPEAALRALDDYARRFPEGALEPEAALLRARAQKQKQSEKH